MKAIFLGIAAIALLSGCATDPVSGGGSDHGNARIAGVVTDRNGDPVAKATVELYPDDYNHITDSTRITPRLAITNDKGEYLFDSLHTGSYTITGTGSYGDIGFVLKNIAVDTAVFVGKVTADAFGGIYIVTDSLEVGEGMALYLPGTRNYHMVKMNNTMVFSMIPQGLLQLKGYNPVTGKSFTLGEDYLCVEIIPGKTLILPSCSPTPFCLRNDSIVTCVQGYPDEEYLLSIIEPTLQLHGVWRYRLSWGDGTISDWTLETGLLHSWKEKGIYPVQSQVLFQGQYFAWSDPIFIEIIDR